MSLMVGTCQYRKPIPVNSEGYTYNLKWKQPEVNLVKSTTTWPCSIRSKTQHFRLISVCVKKPHHLHWADTASTATLSSSRGDTAVTDIAITIKVTARQDAF